MKIAEILGGAWARPSLVSKRELPGCCFPPEAEKTYDRSFEAFAKVWRL